MKPKIKKHVDRIHAIAGGHERFNPTDTAKSLVKLRGYDVGLFFSNLSKLTHQHLGEVLLELPADAFAAAAERLPPHRLARAAEAIESDEATDLIQDIRQADATLAEKILSLMAHEERREVLELSKFEEDQAGAYMEREFLAAHPDDTVGDVKTLIRLFRQNEPAAPIIKLFVTNDEGLLLGTLHFTDLILFDDATTIEEILQRGDRKAPLSIRPASPIADVVRLFEEYDLNIIAVVNSEGKLIGRIVYDDIYDMIRQIETDQAYGLAGVDDEAEESSVSRAAHQRLIWLLFNLVAIMAASAVINLFDATIASYIALAALLPIIAALGGNAGMQALTVTIRKIALGEIEYDGVSAAVKREALIVLANGLSIAVVAALIVSLWFGDIRLGAIVAGALLLNLLVAGTAGTLIPLGLHRLGIDPAVASSIFLTTTTDVFGFFIFLFLAQTFLL
ncbi:magnesium transporter [Sulfurimonas diazotrophicus]|uniref:Magnesium transporter n=1 Tax=Sulfurimonas diazotrophicus TaxID=3131939 RepID=A0ABZ3HCB7_9BACT